MAASPDNVVKRERTVIVISAVVIAALIVAGAVWAARGPSSPAERAMTSGSPSALPAAVATQVAAEQTPAPGSPVSATAQPQDPIAEASPATAPAQATQVQATPTARATPTPSHTRASTSGRSTPTPKPTKTRKPVRTPKPTPKPTKTADPVPAAAHFVVQGKVKKRTYFTLGQLKKLGVYANDYFSRGKEPPEATNTFVGVRLIDVLKAAGLKSDAKKVYVLAADDYSATFSLSQVKADWLDETRAGIKLPMIVAWSEDGTAYAGDHPFRLVMGQAVEGDYNRQYWVRVVVSITVQ